MENENNENSENKKEEKEINIEEHDDEMKNINGLSMVKKRILSTVPIYITGLHSAGIQIISLAMKTSTMSKGSQLIVWILYLLFLSLGGWIEKAIERMTNDRKLKYVFFNSCTAPVMILIYCLGVFDEPLLSFLSWNENLNLETGIKAIQFIILLFGFLLMGVYNLIRTSLLKRRIKKKSNNK